LSFSYAKLADTPNNLETQIIRGVCEDVPARMPGNVGRWSRYIDRVYNLSSMDMRDANLLLFLVIGARSDIAAVEGEVD